MHFFFGHHIPSRRRRRMAAKVGAKWSTKNKGESSFHTCLSEQSRIMLKFELLLMFESKNQLTLTYQARGVSHTLALPFYIEKVSLKAKEEQGIHKHTVFVGFRV